MWRNLSGGPHLPATYVALSTLVMTSLRKIEKDVLVDTYGRWLWVMRTMPAHMATWLAGVVLPPHERYWLNNYFLSFKENITVASRGTSKCLKVGTPVRMADGSLRPVEAVRKGELVMGPDGRGRRVMATSQGFGPLYLVEQSHGISYTVNEHHVLSLFDSAKQIVRNVPVLTYKAIRKSRNVPWFGYTADASLPLSQVTVTTEGLGHWAGFELEGDHLFLLEDGTVTHNSFVHGSMAAELDALLHKGLDTLVVSASGMRGGKLLLEDSRRMVDGELRSQTIPGDYLKRSAVSPKVVRQEPDRWVLKWTSTSQVMTVPSNNATTMRGIRARKAVIDERNFFDGEVVQAVIRPMMTVGGEFDKIASAADSNAIYQITTVDYTFRDFFKEITTMTATSKRQFEVMKSLEQGDHDAYDIGMAHNKNELHDTSFQYSRFDYTDLLIPTELVDDEGEEWEVNYPLPPHLVREDLAKFDKRDGRTYWYTYPVDKKGIEEPLLNGTMDEDLWLAENRNVFIEASGSVYSDTLVKKASEQSIYAPTELPELGEEFFPPVMYTCGDPCVVGADYARERDDFAIVVYRLGPLADGKFDPNGLRTDKQGRVCYGNTPWSSVIWAESWPQMTAAQAAERLRELRKRYNIINKTEFDGYGGIGMDFRGGGSAVRDELANPKPPVVDGVPDPSWVEPVKIYDPTDDSYAHFAAMADQATVWSGLRLLTPSNQENWEWTRYTKASMEQKLLYIGFWEPPGTWSQRMGIVTTTGQRDQNSDIYREWLIGYTGIKKLKNQLVRLQIEMTASGLVRVTMPGKKGSEEGKKDLYSAFIYGWHMAREHIVNATKEDDTLLDIPPVLIEPTHQRGFTSIGWGGLTNR